ncbi:MAG TPA: hypothetical protein PK228_08100, partial [Saprospiraceae bacterium]|nr:hypothetical protein [Saprospiraceae bacterium]
MKKRLWTFIPLVALLVLPAVLFAQTSAADMLARQLIKAPADTHRVTLLSDYAWEIKELRTDEADSLLHEAIALAQRLNFPKGEAAA